MPVMFIGTKRIAKCSDCPGYNWQGESIRRGDHGYSCEFGVYSNVYSDKKIPKNCPLAPLNNLDLVKAELIKENCDGCLNIYLNDDKKRHCYLYEEVNMNCQSKELV